MFQLYTLHSYYADHRDMSKGRVPSIFRWFKCIVFSYECPFGIFPCVEMDSILCERHLVRSPIDILIL